MTDNRFYSKDGEQNVGQGEGAVGKQINIFLYPLKPRTLVFAEGKCRKSRVIQF